MGAQCYFYRVLELAHFSVQSKVVDTPDICMEEMEIKDRSKELEDWLLLTSPGPTAILLIIRGDVRFTPEEDTICQTTMKLLGDHYYDSLVVVFTMKDNVKTNIEVSLEIIFKIFIFLYEFVPISYFKLFLCQSYEVYIYLI